MEPWRRLKALEPAAHERAASYRSEPTVLYPSIEYHLSETFAEGKSAVPNVLDAAGEDQHLNAGSWKPGLFYLCDAVWYLDHRLATQAPKVCAADFSPVHGK